MRLLLTTLLSILFIKTCFALPVGFNQAWFKNSYGNQYMNSDFDKDEVHRIFKLAKKAGSHSLRLWFFESSKFPMIKFDGITPIKLKDEYISNVLSMLSIAKNYQIKVYMTLFDAHQFNRLKYSKKQLSYLKSFLDRDNGQKFLENILGPLLQAIDEARLSETIDKIDLINEMDTIVKRLGFKKRWVGVGKMLCQWRGHIQRIKSFAQTPVTFSIRLHPLIWLPKNILEDNGPLACADFIDFHSYSNTGIIHRCNWLSKYAKNNNKDLILGEFGQGFFKHVYSDKLQKNVTRQYLKSAKTCGFKQAYAWRLSDIRNGKNKEARYSYEAFGKLRPAFNVIKDNNRSLIIR
jgi:hypothetical protein